MSFQEEAQGRGEEDRRDRRQVGRRATATLLLWGLLALAPAPGAPAQGAAGADPAQQRVLQSKARLVRRLIERARGRDGDAQRLEEARSLVAEAESSLERGADLAEVERSLNRALRLASTAARGAGHSQVRTAREQARYRELRQGVESFRKALERTAAEKGRRAGEFLDIAELERLVAEGESHARKGRYGEAGRLLSGAYDLTSEALARIRAHETVEHRLVFATPADELAYEMERYRSHELLVQMVINQGKLRGRALVKSHADIDQSRALHEQAREQAARGDPKGAIHTQEAATRHLVTVLRRAGMFVPY